jgi:hypothetical protein
MIFGSNRRERGIEDALQQSDDVTGPPAHRVRRQREAWRRAAQKVIRAWSEWSAAESCRRSELYRRYTAALDEEEVEAAALERAHRDAMQTCGHIGVPAAKP